MTEIKPGSWLKNTEEKPTPPKRRAPRKSNPLRKPPRKSAPFKDESPKRISDHLYQMPFMEHEGMRELQRSLNRHQENLVEA